MARSVSARTTVIIAAAALLLGALATLAFTCNTGESQPLPGASTVPDTIHETVYVQHAPRFIEKRGDSIFVGICDSTCAIPTVPPKAVKNLWNFSSLFPAFAKPLLDAFVPQRPKNLIELWGKGGHDLFGGYGGAFDLYVNLDVLRITNVTAFAELGYLHGFYFMIGILGKLWGWL